MQTRADLSCVRYLATLFANAPSTSFIELRYRTHTGMGRSFYSTNDVERVSHAIARLADHTDVYVGVLPRWRQASTRADVMPVGSVIWADCDTPESVSAMRHLPTPSIVIASGTAYNCHAYWLLDSQVSIDVIEMANRRLAVSLGSDESCSNASRILRPISYNHKHNPPTEVRLLSSDAALRYQPEELVGVCGHATSHSYLSPSRDNKDPLLVIEPAEYFQTLAGLAVLRSGKVRCPFHEDHTPSLHVYREPSRGWYCYGCGRGGSIYDFAALLWGIGTRGSSFTQLRRHLASIFTPYGPAALRRFS